MSCNGVELVREIETMNKNSNFTIENPAMAPKIIKLRGVMPAANAATFFYKRDPLGISATNGAETGGIAFTAAVGTSIAVLNTWLLTYAIISLCMNQAVSDSTQLDNSMQDRVYSIDGEIKSATTWADSAAFASNQNQNLLNIGQCVIFTNQKFLRFPLDADPLVAITTTLTFKNLISVPYGQLSAYLAAKNLQNVSGGC